MANDRKNIAQWQGRPVRLHLSETPARVPSRGILNLPQPESRIIHCTTPCCLHRRLWEARILAGNSHI